MSIELLWQAVLAGIANGFVYALIGSGLAVIFRGTKIINAMQGEFAIIGAIVAVFVLRALPVHPLVGALAGIAAGALVGLVIDVLLVRPMQRRRAGEESFLLLTIGLAVTISAGLLYFVGRVFYQLPAIGGFEVAEILGAFVPIHALALVAISIAVVIGLRLFFTRSLLGLSMAAAAIDPDGAATNGIDVARMRSLTLMLGGMMGALAGVLVSPLVAVNYAMGIGLTLKGFAAAIMGGLANPMGAVLGGLIIGIAEIGRRRDDLFRLSRRDRHGAHDRRDDGHAARPSWPRGSGGRLRWTRRPRCTGSWWRWSWRCSSSPR